MSQLSGFPREQIDLIKRTVAKGCTDDELALFLHTAKRLGLDPLSKQIYAIKRQDRRNNTSVMTIQVAIDGYRAIADRTEKYSPGRKPEFTYLEGDTTHTRPHSATAYVMKYAQGQWHEVGATAHWDEYAQMWQGQPSGMWKNMPHSQLAKCAESLALRKAFPDTLSGVYTNEEMDQADNEHRDPAPSRPQAPQLQKPPAQVASPPAEPKNITPAAEESFDDEEDETGELADTETVKSVIAAAKALNGTGMTKEEFESDVVSISNGRTRNQNKLLLSEARKLLKMYSRNERPVATPA